MIKRKENIVSAEGLTKVFKVHLRDKSGLLPAIQSLFVRKYSEVVAVKKLDMAIRQGEIRGLIGPNGAGKSTTIKIFSGILFPTSGSADIMGHTPWHDRERLVKRIGVVFGQKSQLIWDLPAIDTFQLHRKMYDIPDNVYDENIRYFTALLNVAEVIRKPVRQISLGERMKCEFICALLHEPPLVFLDEPTIGLDIFSKEAIRGFIKGVNREKGTTFILTTHDLNDIENLCERVSIINKGTIVFDDTIDKLKSYFADRKMVELHFRRKIASSELAGYDVKEFSPLAARVELDMTRTKLEDEVARIFRTLPIRDINISNIDIEEVIKFIYAS
ncbi:MAG: ATP-binding cassette domain-containing protein [Spirochaetales bacterium]|nr:ATP-binding cassette domain-containing protein [Spirochaetales bacterium]